MEKIVIYFLNNSLIFNKVLDEVISSSINIYNINYFSELLTSGIVYKNPPNTCYNGPITLMTNAKKGISACQVTRDTNLPWTTVWRTIHKIKNAMVNDEIKLLAGILEMDETYVGGKPSKLNDIDNPKPNLPRGRGTSKECVRVYYWKKW